MLSNSLHDSHGHTFWWKGVLDAVEEIDIRLAQLASHFGGRWDIHKTSQATQAGKPTAVDYYNDIQAAKIWNQQRSTRIALHEFQLDFCEELQVSRRAHNNDGLEILPRRSVEVIMSTSSEICASIPFHLGRLDATGRECSSDAQQVAGACALIWPLETIAKCRYVGEDHRLVARSTLEEIGHAIGVREATRKISELSNRNSNSFSSGV